MDEAEQEQVELRLMSDAAFSEEFDILVDEISIRYVAGELEGDEKDRVERYFLQAPERQSKARVMCELLHYSALTRGEEPVKSETSVAVADDVGLLARVRKFWNADPLMFRLIATAAVIVVVVGVVFLSRSGRPATSYATLTLTSRNAERGQDTNELASVKLAPGVDELRLQLMLPAQPTQPKSYRAEIFPPPGHLTIVSLDSQSVVIAIPMTDLKRDRYAIRLFAIYADGREERLPGYAFRVE